ncbi:MAG: TetR/AcrR family transcriptional regulator [Methylotenera sp.]|nr:TetR/AcrR family transcriptional regulator [Methylotenera sp.]NOT65079.1 TetR/AcrR family transcriptional regulator [Methylotenera sp.]
MMSVMKQANSKQNLSSRKEITHARIVETAARVIRRSGYDGTGVADIMKEAGLTHGGFYAHFSSRDAMLAEAADRAGEDTIAIIKRVLAEVPSDQALQTLMNVYLSNEHIANFETGCSLAALGSEMPRQAPEVRNASTCRVKEMLALIESRLSANQSDAYDKALVIFSTMVGTLLLARAVDDPELSEAFRSAALKHYDAKD